MARHLLPGIRRLTGNSFIFEQDIMPIASQIFPWPVHGWGIGPKKPYIVRNRRYNCPLLRILCVLLLHFQMFIVYWWFHAVIMLLVWPVYLRHAKMVWISSITVTSTVCFQNHSVLGHALSGGRVKMINVSVCPSYFWAVRLCSKYFIALPFWHPKNFFDGFAWGWLVIVYPRVTTFSVHH